MDRYVNDDLNVGKEISTQDQVISIKVTPSPDATFEGSFLQTFNEPLDADDDEEVDLYEQIARMDIKTVDNTIQHANNASAIATRYTKSQTDSLLAKHTDPSITGDINIREGMRSPIEPLNERSATKLYMKQDWLIACQLKKPTSLLVLKLIYHF